MALYSPEAQTVGTAHECFENRKKGISYLKHYGLKDFVVRLEEKRDEAAMPYESWYESHKVSETVLKQQQVEVQFWENRPKISIVTPLYHTPEGFCGK